ncbi:MAG: thiamine pyrophosphate-dependent enzyme, partial [Acidimicrobiales bacterium]
AKTDRSWREKIELNVTRWWEVMQRQAMLDSGQGDMVNPMRVVHELSEKIPLNAIVSSDSGSAANWYARYLKIRGEIRGSLSGNLATMGPGVPYAIGAKFGHPDRPVIALVGDGAMQMNGLAELVTILHYYKEWSDPRLIVCVFHNNDLNQVTWEMRAMEGSPKFAESQTLPDISYASFANSIGLVGIDVGKGDQLADAWTEAFSADRPCVLDVRTDPSFPPIPPHANFEQIKDMTAALIRGDEDAWQIMRLGFKTKLQEFLPGPGKKG